MTARHVGVLIVGAGIAGLGLGMRLRRAGITDFVVIERSDGVGGTWHDNVYPGVACDIPSHLYNFSFRRRPAAGWSRRFATGAEILHYLRECAEQEGVMPHVRLREELLEARWSSAAKHWEVRSSRGQMTVSMLIIAAGRLSDPAIPEVPGREESTLPMVHTSRWRELPELSGRVALVGTGASAVQVLPHLAERAESVTVFQRHAPWVLPRQDHEIDPRAAVDDREQLAEQGDDLFAARVAASAEAAALKQRSLSHMRAQVRSATLRRAVTPDYPIGCKRAVFSDDWYPALQRVNVQLETSALASINQATLRSEHGREQTVDCVVWATGFKTTSPAYAGRIVGRGGRSLAAHWEKGMTAFASTAVSGFPNMFILDGPNTGLGHHSAFETIEAQHDYVLEAMADWYATVQPLEVSAAAERAYTRMIDDMSRSTVWLDGGCSSWYVDPRSHRLTLLWPERVSLFKELNGHFRREPYRIATR